MPERYANLFLDCIELFGKLTPYIIGLFVSVTVEPIADTVIEIVIKLFVTSLSMLIGSLVVYFLKPIIISKIENWKKK